MHPVWTIFSRRMLSQLAYWLSALGYNLGDRSVMNRIYLLYFCGFWGAWGVAMLALVGGGLARGLANVQASISPDRLMVALPAGLLIAWAVVTLWRVTGRSPFVFSEEDAYLVCQTPLSRRRVALAWFAQGMFGFVVVLASATIILAFAIVAWRFPSEPGMSLLSFSLRTSGLGLILVLPAQLGMQAALWSVGALRLRGRDRPGWLRPAAMAGALALLVGSFVPSAAPILAAPFSLPFDAAFGHPAQVIPLGIVIVISWLGLLAGLGLLVAVSGKMSLGEAARETTHVAAIGLARSYGQFELVDAILMRRRLGTTHGTSRLVTGGGRAIVLRKAVLQSRRTFRVRDALGLIWVLGLSAGMFRTSSLVLQLIIAGVWTVNLGGFMTIRLRNDLAHWWLWRSLPLPGQTLFAQELAVPWGLASLMGWLALLVSDMAGPAVLVGVVLVPLLAASVAMASSADILRRARARVLMSPSLADENVPRVGASGVIWGLVSVLLPFGMLVGTATTPGGAIFGRSGDSHRHGAGLAATRCAVGRLPDHGVGPGPSRRGTCSDRWAEGASRRPGRASGGSDRGRDRCEWRRSDAVCSSSPPRRPPTLSVAMPGQVRSPVKADPSSKTNETLSAECPVVDKISPATPISFSKPRLASVGIIRLSRGVISR